jgi:NTE family protein
MTNSQRSTRRQLLEGIPLFSCLSAAELDAVADLFSEVSCRKGETICREGEEGDSFFVILSGELEVRTGPDGERVIGRLGPGDFVGEMALLTGGKRSATVTVARGGKLLVLDRTTFERYFRRNPKVLEYFARVLSQRLVATSRGEGIAKQTLAVGVTGRRGLKGKSLVASALAGFLKDFSGREVLLLQTSSRASRRGPRPVLPLLSGFAQAPIDRIKNELKPGGAEPTLLTVEVDPAGSAEFFAECFSALIAKVSDIFPYVVLDLACEPATLSRCADEVCDVAIELVAQAEPGAAAEEGAHTRRYRVLNLYNRESSPIPIRHCEPFVLSVDPELVRRDSTSALGYLRQNAGTPASASLRRLARKVLGGTVGVAVGGGAAFGIAHVGVFRVLEENGIPVDLVAGTSMGSLVAIGYAAGIRGAEMREIASRIGNVRTTLSALDFTLTKPGLLAGSRLIEIFGPLLGDTETFEELVLPCQVVATDIQSGERVAIGSGRLDAAFRASCSAPLIWAPVRRDGRVLVDGAIVEPVPAQLVSEMGADVCIAVNVVPPLVEGVETVISKMYRKLNRLNPLSYLSDSRDLSNMLDIVMNSIQMLQYELGNFKAISADVRINPDLSGYTWIEFYRAMELIERGAEAAERALPEIRRVLDERTGASISPRTARQERAGAS